MTNKKKPRKAEPAASTVAPPAPPAPPEPPAPPPVVAPLADLPPPPAAELDYVTRLAADLVTQLGPQLLQHGQPSPVLLYGLSAAAKVVEVTAQLELERAKREQPERVAEYEAQWLLVLQRREQYEQHAAEQARAGHEVKP